MKRFDRRVTARQVRQLPVGTIVRVNHYDRYGEPVYTECVIIPWGKIKKLKTTSPWSPTEHYLISKETDRRWYTIEGEREP